MNIINFQPVTSPKKLKKRIIGPSEGPYLSMKDNNLMRDFVAAREKSAIEAVMSFQESSLIRWIHRESAK